MLINKAVRNLKELSSPCVHSFIYAHLKDAVEIALLKLLSLLPLLSCSTMQSPQIPTQLLTVWIVEDSAPYRTTVEDLIEDVEDMVCEAAFATCEDFLKALSGRTAPHVVLMDITLPGMSGIKGILEARKKIPGLPFVMLTIHEDYDKIFEAFCAGATGYVSKAARSQFILEAIREAKNGETLMSPKIARRVIDAFARPENLHSKNIEDYNLTPREEEVLNLCVEGKTKPEIAAYLFLSVHTIDSHVRKIYAKLQVRTRQALVKKVFEEGLL